MKNLLAVLNTARRPMTSEETKGICLVLLHPLVEEQQLALKAVFDDEDYRTAAWHFARMHLHAMKASLTRNNLRMTFRLLVGTGEEREGIIAGCLEATFELTVKIRAALEREEATLSPIEGRAP
ncbi:hypothetical protein [Archangium sp.]|uniref:hypothetical protein n=1 Tax=Archangium sp. TaxID=1872627 RepID=UPI002D761963|nr:hypothetical protein [Archangium sp.]HYO58520.1 hypothetical protein [Archangium sp.]